MQSAQNSHECQHARDGVCLISKKLSGGLNAELDEKACAACMKDDRPMAINKVTVSRAVFAIRKDGGDATSLLKLLKPRHAKMPPRNKTSRGPAPIESWPKWALAISRVRVPSDTGVGDTFERFANKFGGARIKKLSKKLGMPCGCSARKKDWNTTYSYKVL